MQPSVDEAELRTLVTYVRVEVVTLREGVRDLGEVGRLEGVRGLVVDHLRRGVLVRATDEAQQGGSEEQGEQEDANERHEKLR